MKIAIIAPSSVPYVIGGAENLWWGLLNSFNAQQGVDAELIKIPSPERNFQEVIRSYQTFADLNLDHFDRIISTKYPAWMVHHHDHVVYMQHKLRGLYDTYPKQLATNLPSRQQFPQLLQPLYDLLITPPDSRVALPEIFTYLEQLLQQQAELPTHWFAFPAGLIRSIVHMLDHIALLPQHIAQYSAISQEVRGRTHYFPKYVNVDVFYHPTNLQGLIQGEYQYFFTASRLDAPKRIDLIIKAWIAAHIDIPLYIAGTGPEADTLQQLAKSHKKIIFLGYVSEQALVEYYANTLAVVFIPKLEDYGLITVEAMQAAKAVLTTNDSGGVTELVTADQTGWVVDNAGKPLAQMMQYIAQNPDEAKQLGQNAFKYAQRFSWQKLCNFLNKRPILNQHLVVVNTFSVYPAMSGGQLRIYHLYRYLSNYCRVILISLVPHSSLYERVQLAQNFTEIRIPKSSSHEYLEKQLSAKLAISAGDIATLLYYHETPLLQQTIHQYVQNAAWVVSTHPYAYSAIRSVYAGEIIYESHNVEAQLKAAMLDSNQHKSALQLVQQIEQDCIRLAPLVIACTESDAKTLATLYGQPKARCIIANGVDINSTPFSTLSHRAALKQELGYKNLAVLFMGSNHKPNVVAALQIIDIAKHSPQLDFFIMGSVCHAHIFKEKGLPDNLSLLGVISNTEKQLWLAICDIAINPMLSGSGSNLKVLEAAAVGQLIISTPFGTRGGLLRKDIDCIELEHKEMSDFLNQLSQGNLSNYQAMLESAYQQVKQFSDWRALAQKYWHKLQQLSK